MARFRALDGRAPIPVEGPWRLALTPPGACADPAGLAAIDGWVPAPVPGTAAGALRAAGRWSEAAPSPIHSSDVWYRAPVPGRGRERLRFEGLATLAEIWLDGKRLLESDSMFLAHEVEAELTGASELAICFRALSAHLARPQRRGRWRPRLATPGALRNVRTSLLGFMPGWCPPVDLVGPYRPITRAPADAPRVSIDLVATLDGAIGRLAARVTVEGADEGAKDCPVLLRCDGRETVLRAAGPGLYAGALSLPGIAPWWPHTHGEPRLHAVEAAIGGRRVDLGRVGFRSITLARPFAEGLALAVNGVPVFCRGACWTPPDLVGLRADADACRPALALAREAGMNMLRVPGTTLYASGSFHDLCDEMGILVWQDLMLANFDYPANDPAFRARLTAELDQLLDRARGPSLAVVCGGSEVAQQAAMLGFPRAVWEGGFVAEALPGLVAARRPDVIAVADTPTGGDLPFETTAGVAHYFGVGAYRRPLEDARRAEIGFAAECLAFANVPEPASLDQAGLADPGSAAWAAAIPRDRGADWDFEGVRDHYVALLYGADPESLRRADPDRYLALGRAAVAEAMEATFAEWRRARSRTRGGLVLALRDLAPGAGWGVIAADGRPKSAWYALRRAFRPVQLTLSDEGLNGLHVHVHNETEQALDGHLTLAFTDADGRSLAQAERAVRVEARGSETWTAAGLLGRFFDATRAYAFGAPGHTLGHAVLADPQERPLADAFHFPAGRDAGPRAIGLRAGLALEGGAWVLRVGAERHALAVHVDVEAGTGARVSDNWFHLAPGQERRLSFGHRGAGTAPRGTVRALNGDAAAAFGPATAGRDAKTMLEGGIDA